MASVASQLIEEVTAHAQCDSLEDAREICADGTYFPKNLRKRNTQSILIQQEHKLSRFTPTSGVHRDTVSQKNVWSVT